MSTNRMEPPKPGAEAPKTAEAKPAEAILRSGGLGAWLPLIAMSVLMPVIAYAMTTVVMVPKLKTVLAGDAEEAAAPSAPASSAHGEKAAPKKSAEPAGHGAKAAEGKKTEAKKGAEAGKKTLVPLEKILGTVAGTQGSRYLLVKLTLVGAGEAFKDKVEENRDQLMDVASSTLSSKTMSDLEKPGSRNVIRTELIMAFNNTLGADTVQDIYFTEFATQ